MASQIVIGLSLVLYFTCQTNALGLLLKVCGTFLPEYIRLLTVLASYIKPCSRSDPNLIKCAITNAQEAIPFIVKGDPKYHIPNMQPMKISEIKINSNRDLSLILTDIVVEGLEKAIVKNIKIDFANRKSGGTVFVPDLVARGKYTINGQLLVLPIRGNGDFNITTSDTNYSFGFDYVLESRKGKEYAKITDSELKYDPARVRFYLGNLFNDAALSEQMNNLLNENWRDVHKDLGPAVSDSVNVIMKTIYMGVMERVAFDDFYLP